MKPLEEVWWLDICALLQHGTIRLANGWSIQKQDITNRWHDDYILRMGEETKTFKSFSDLMTYITFHGATFHPIIVDAEDAKRERIERHLEKSRGKMGAKTDAR